jgi:hypothetical protein
VPGTEEALGVSPVVAALGRVRTDPAEVGRVAEIIHASLRGRGVDHLRAAVSELRAAEASESCAWCRSHVVAVRVLCEDLVRIAEMGEDVGRGEVGELARRIGRAAEEIGALGTLGRIVHRVKGLR